MHMSHMYYTSWVRAPQYLPEDFSKMFHTKHYSALSFPMATKLSYRGPCEWTQRSPIIVTTKTLFLFLPPKWHS